MKALHWFALLFVATPIFAATARVDRDIAYFEPKNERQILDVYAPTTGTNHPVVVWIHGGGWQAGSKAEVNAKPQAFVDQGCVFVAMNYRFFPKATIKEITTDIAKAIAWAHRNAARYGGDPNTMFVMGHSAGAQLAALVCIDERYLAAEGLPLSIIKGCVPVDGDTYDVAKQVEMTESAQVRPPFDSHRRKFGHAAALKELSAVTHVARNKGIPPFLLLHIADYPESRTGLQAQILATSLILYGGVSANVLAVPGKTHVTLDTALGTPNDPATQVLFEFVQKQLKPAR